MNEKELALLTRRLAKDPDFLSCLRFRIEETANEEIHIFSTALYFFTQGYLRAREFKE